MSIKTSLYVCDTNVIIRYLLGETAPLGQQATAIFTEVRTGGKRIVLLECVFAEVVFVLTKVYKIPRSLLAEKLTSLLHYKGVLLDDKSALGDALDIFKASNLHIVDCILAAKSQALEAELLSFDKQLVALC